jgi:polysaccharide export outer membrane protein
MLGSAALTVLTACQTGNFSAVDEQKLIQSDPMVLREGDTVRVTFPAAPELDQTNVQIKQDGRISLKIVGEVPAAGLTVAGLQQELLKLYGPQLQNKQLMIAVEGSALSIYVTGAVLRPGKVISQRPLTALEAIMEAGGFDSAKANQKAVAIIRHQGGAVQRYKINLRNELSGRETQPFNLKSFDIVYVPERFVWF